MIHCIVEPGDREDPWQCVDGRLNQAELIASCGASDGHQRSTTTPRSTLPSVAWADCRWGSRPSPRSHRGTCVRECRRTVDVQVRVAYRRRRLNFSPNSVGWMLPARTLAAVARRTGAVRFAAVGPRRAARSSAAPRAHRPADRVLDELVAARPHRRPPSRAALACPCRRRGAERRPDRARRPRRPADAPRAEAARRHRPRRRTTRGDRALRQVVALRRRHRLVGVGVGLAAATVATFGGYLGGWLAFGEAKPRERSTARSHVA